MRCLMCAKKLSEGSWKDVLFIGDPLCEKCRKQWERRKISFEVEGIHGNASYIYNKAFSSCLIQFKECNDEALKDVFLYEVKNSLQRKYHGYTLCLMPSSAEKIKERGFSHLKEMFSCLHMEILEPFEKQGTQSQKKLPLYLRKELAHQIKLKEGIHLPDKILLCDDTITSGSTLKGAIQCLPRKGKAIQIYCVSANASWL